MSAIRLTAAQAIVRWMIAQKALTDCGVQPYFAGVWAIFGHGNVAGLGEALAQSSDELPTYRAHNEQGMAHAAIAFAKASRRERAMACTTSIGPGATNMITAAALAHVNRLPVLFLPGDVYASRRPDPVLQQIEDFGDGTVSANDCFRPVSRYFDRIVRPEQLIDALPRAMAVLQDPIACGPVTLAVCQDVQAEAFNFPANLFRERVWRRRRPQPEVHELEAVVERIRISRRPLIIAGGGVLYSRAEAALLSLAEQTGIPVSETQAGKSIMPWNHSLALGAIGVTGSAAANRAAREADLVIGIGTRLQDFTTGSRTLFGADLVQVNVGPYDAHKQGALPIVGDARVAIEAMSGLLAGYCVPADWRESNAAALRAWHLDVDAALEPRNEVPSDAEVIGAVLRNAPPEAVAVCAAGGLPGELHKLWRASSAGGYHAEYGFSCMGYEIAGALGAKMAAPEREHYVFVGDGSYMMMNSELATAVMMDVKLTIVLLDNRGFGCINRLQRATGGRPFNNLLADSRRERIFDIDFAMHARSMGANAIKVASIAELEAALLEARRADGCQVIVIDTDPMLTTEAGGHWWDVAVPEISQRPAVQDARRAYAAKIEGETR